MLSGGCCTAERVFCLLLLYCKHTLLLWQSASKSDDSSLALAILCASAHIMSTRCRTCRYAVPKQLAQWRLVVPAQHKPLALLGLLLQLAGSSTIVFASSLETTHRCVLYQDCCCCCASHKHCVQLKALQVVLDIAPMAI
jgi:hypothetical protein